MKVLWQLSMTLRSPGLARPSTIFSKVRVAALFRHLMAGIWSSPVREVETINWTRGGVVELFWGVRIWRLLYRALLCETVSLWRVLSVLRAGLMRCVCLRGSFWLFLSRMCWAGFPPAFSGDKLEAYPTFQHAIGYCCAASYFSTTLATGSGLMVSVIRPFSFANDMGTSLPINWISRGFPNRSAVIVIATSLGT